MRKTTIAKICATFCTAVLVTIRSAQALEMSSNIQTYLETATVTEFGYPSGTEQQQAEFTNWLVANWAAVLSEISVIAPDERRQKVIVAGSEFLSGTNYLTFLSGLLDKYEQGKVKKSVVIESISPGGKKYGFLAFNYQHPSVQALCSRVKTLFANDAELQSLMNDVLSGEQGKQAGAALAMENRPEPDILPTPTP